MSKYEITIQSNAGSIGPFHLVEPDERAALISGSRIADDFLSDSFSSGFLRQAWIVIARSEAGDIVASAPLR